MISGPQIENGNYTRIHNDILADLCGAGLSANELRCVFCVLRRTYGFGKTTDQISVSQFVEWVGSGSRHQIQKALAKLEQRNILLVDRSGKTAAYKFNKYSDTWLDRTLRGVRLDCTPRGVQSESDRTPRGVRDRTPRGVTQKKKENNEVVIGAIADNPVRSWSAMYEDIRGLPIADREFGDQVRDWIAGGVGLEHWRLACCAAKDAKAKTWRYARKVVAGCMVDGWGELEDKYGSIGQTNSDTLSGMGELLR